MSAYIKLSTLEYPRHIGDIQTDPAGMADYAEVQWIDQPKFNPARERCKMGQPKKQGDVWMTNWEVTPIPAAELAAMLQAQITQAAQKRLDDFAISGGYDSILSACTYATSMVPKFKADGQCCVNARDATWARLYEVLAEVQAGKRPMPTGFADIEPLLPALVWPG